MSVQLFIRDIQFMSQVEFDEHRACLRHRSMWQNIPVSWSLCPWVAEASSSWEEGEGWKSWSSSVHFLRLDSSAFPFQDLLNPGEPEKILEISEFSMLRCVKHFYNAMLQSNYLFFQIKGHWRAKEIVQVFSLQLKTFIFNIFQSSVNMFNPKI